LINNILGMILFRYFGRLVGRVGERWVLTGNFVLLIFVFAGYAFLNSLLLLSILFVLDHVLFGFGIAVDSYFKKVAVSKEEITSNLSLAQTINHIAAVIVPLVGGVVWETLGSEATFLIGAAIAVLSLLVTQLMRTGKAGPVEAPAA
jgi:predicted MFS family arabinose efflux permease